jgi:hypothetical protein
MSFQVARELAKRFQPFDGKGAGFRPCGIENRRGVSFGEHKSIVGRIPRIVGMEPHHVEKSTDMSSAIDAHDDG